jgi:hypothetical protein
MVVEQHPTLLNVTLHPAKVGQTWYQQRPRPPQPLPAQPLWRESVITSGGGGGGGVSSRSSSSGGDNAAGDGVGLVGSGGDRGEIGHSDGDGGGELTLTEDDVKEQDTPKIQQWLPVEPYTYYSPGHHEITDIPYHNSNDNALHIRVAHDTLEDQNNAMRSGAVEARSLIHILYFAAPVFSFQVFL